MYSETQTHIHNASGVNWKSFKVIVEKKKNFGQTAQGPMPIFLNKGTTVCECVIGLVMVHADAPDGPTHHYIWME